MAFVCTAPDTPRASCREGKEEVDGGSRPLFTRTVNVESLAIVAETEWVVKNALHATKFDTACTCIAWMSSDDHSISQQSAMSSPCLDTGPRVKILPVKHATQHMHLEY